MERLTKRDALWNYVFFSESACMLCAYDKEKVSTFCENTTCSSTKDRSCPYLRVIDRLAEYEDTGLTPEEIKALKGGGTVNKFKEPSRPAHFFANDAVNEKVVAFVSDLRDDWLCIMNHRNSNVVYVILENGDTVGIDISKEKLKGGGTE